MNYNISSDKFDNPLLKDLLKERIDFFDSFQYGFLCDRRYSTRYHIKKRIWNAPERKTVDLIEDNLIEREGFKKIREQKQRFLKK